MAGNERLTLKPLVWVQVCACSPWPITILEFSFELLHFFIEGRFQYNRGWYFKGLLSAQLQGDVIPTPLPHGNHNCEPALAMAKVSENTQKCQSLGEVNVQCPALYLHLQEEQGNSFQHRDIYLLFSCFRCLQTCHLGHHHYKLSGRKLNARSKTEQSFL